jgi:F-type H+-transporting ATPase subunit epsilon
MAATLALDIVTPDRQVLSRRVSSVTASGVEGEFCILPQHIPFLTALQVGSLSYRLEGKVHFVFVKGGFADISGERVLILAEAAELPEEIDVNRAMRARERALARLQAAHQEEVDHARAKSALQRAISRLKIHQDAGLAGKMAAMGSHTR